MNTIWKFTLTLTDRQEITLPAGAQLLTVQLQDGEPRLWALVDGYVGLTQVRTIEIHGTGNPIESGPQRQYVATFQQPPFVWHVFERL